MQATIIQDKKRKNIPVISVFVIIGLLLVMEGFLETFVIHRSGTSTNTNTSISALKAPVMPAGAPTALNMGMAGAPISVTDLQAPLTATHMKNFTLTARAADISVGTGITLPTWTFNGTDPGPTLRVQQGDLVVVTLVNHLSFGITIHWHGVNVPNSADGVAGVTQDAVKPGQSYIYRFIAKDPGTYWYHSHQFSYDETTGGLYGMLIVDPAIPVLHADVDESVALHEWNGPNNQMLLTINSTTGKLNETAHAGQWVRLRIVNTSSTASGAPQLVTLVGAPFQVAALDGHDLNGPQWLHTATLPIASAQRYDLFFQMPAHSPVELVTSTDNQRYQATPAVVFGQGSTPAALPPVNPQWFDLTSYGIPESDPIDLQSHFDATYGITLNNHTGNSLGRMGMIYTLNGKSFPDTGMIMLQEGQLVKMQLDNQSDLYHPIHLHGHIFTVLTHNGHALTGSSVHLDTINIPPHERYDIAFYANNPGIWMLHCHNLLHANWGMDMMVMYNVSTPYTIGSLSGNFPD